MIDSHCHLDCDAFDQDRPPALARAARRGVQHIIVPAVGEATWEPILALASAISPTRCHAALGIHPIVIPGLDPADDAGLMERLRARVSQSRPVAIGECGLDTTIDLTRAPFERQQAVLRAQVAIARDVDLPVILHARGPGCYAALLDLLESEPLPKAGGVIHSYGGGVDLVRRFAALPLMFGFAGPATYPNARKIRASIAAVPEDRLLAETDAPDQTPVPYRPGRSEPAYVPEIIAAIASARGASASQIEALTTANARRLFGLDP